ncbi:MAG TPA: hypothetical protein VN702_22390 [Acetobacteraceae bacterium]|nr:hypothetical protein [Acetobacteraceae bacterium]
MISKTGYRLYQNLLMPSRVEEYRRLLQSLVNQGYVFLTIAELARCSRNGMMPELSCIIRMDVDSDVATAETMFDVAQSLAVRATYYFRLSTLDSSLMRRIAQRGSEVGFHYEELATTVKRLGLCNREQIDQCIPEIRAAFRKNIAVYAQFAGALPQTIASHGDWVNRKLRIPNQYALDQSLRKQFGIIAEAYDDWLNGPVKFRFSDNDAPDWWKPQSPSKAIDDRVSCIYFLLHPRQWRANAWENVRIDVTRMAEGLRYSIRCGALGWHKKTCGASRNRAA